MNAIILPRILSLFVTTAIDQSIVREQEIRTGVRAIRAYHCANIPSHGNQIKHRPIFLQEWILAYEVVIFSLIILSRFMTNLTLSSQ